MPVPAPEMGIVAAARRTPSMEAEPKTLTLEQLKFAREAALYVVSTKTREEAIRIFTEGLKPVRSVMKPQLTTSSSFSSSSSSSDEDDSTPRGGAGRTRCRRRHGPPRFMKRDIATAPF